MLQIIESRAHDYLSDTYSFAGAANMITTQDVQDDFIDSLFPKSKYKINQVMHKTIISNLTGQLKNALKTEQNKKSINKIQNVSVKKVHYYTHIIKNRTEVRDDDNDDDDSI